MAPHELSSVAKLAIAPSLLLEQEYLRGSSGYLEGLWALELDLTLVPNLIHSFEKSSYSVCPALPSMQV